MHAGTPGCGSRAVLALLGNLTRLCLRSELATAECAAVYQPLNAAIHALWPETAAAEAQLFQQMSAARTMPTAGGGSGSTQLAPLLRSAATAPLEAALRQHCPDISVADVQRAGLVLRLHAHGAALAPEAAALAPASADASLIGPQLYPALMWHLAHCQHLLDTHPGCCYAYQEAARFATAVGICGSMSNALRGCEEGTAAAKQAQREWQRQQQVPCWKCLQGRGIDQNRCRGTPCRCTQPPQPTGPAACPPAPAFTCRLASCGPLCIIRSPGQCSVDASGGAGWAH